MSSNASLSYFTMKEYLGTFFNFVSFRFIEFSINSVNYERIVLRFN